MDLASPAVSGTSVYANGLRKMLSSYNILLVYSENTRTHYMKEERIMFLQQRQYCVQYILSLLRGLLI